VIDDPSHRVTKGLPANYLAPANEWYIWQPSPRLNPNVKVLLTLDPSNYPLGFKDTLTGGDLPVVWTNVRYKMIYLNMGHGNKIFSDRIQNRLFENALLWLAGFHSRKD
jgi:type 1 glutamine amidotransferase